MTSATLQDTVECAMPKECSHKRNNVLLRENIKELQAQLQQSFKRISELNHIIDRLKIQISSSYSAPEES